MARESPSVAELIAAVKSLTRPNDGTFQSAWKASFLDPFHCCEQGGYIYVDFPVPATLTRVFVSNARAGTTMNQRTPGPNASIDLNSPGISQNNVILAANFHTHPLSDRVGGNPEPSRSDMENAYFRGVPGIVVSRRGIYSYGPDRRESVQNPKGYPPSVPQGPLNFRLVPVVPPPGPPTTVQGLQWPEGIPGAARAKVAEAAGKAARDDAHAGAGDVISVEWSDEGVEYGELLVDSCN